MAEISVIIPVVNEAKLLPELIKFLCAQDSNKKLEIIVVDGKSTDDTVEVALSCDVQLVESDKRCRATQMNLGAKKATTNNLYFVHADVIPPKNFISEIVRMDKKEVELAFFRQIFDKMNPFLAVNSFFTRYKKLWCRGGDQTIFVKKDLFEKLNGFDDKFVIMEEYDFMTRALKLTDYEIMDGATIVSTRKYSTNSYFKVMRANLKAIRSFKKGVSPEVIKADYTSALNPY